MEVKLEYDTTQKTENLKLLNIILHVGVGCLKSYIFSYSVVISCLGSS